MTLDELATLPLWKILPAGVRKVLDAAKAEGWELHGKGATIAFRLDRDQDELDLPLYVMWNIGITPKGALSLAGGKAGVPHATLTTSDVFEYLADPTVVYPLEPEEAVDEPESHGDETGDAYEWDESKTPEENLSASLKATLVSDKPAPKPLRLGAPPVPSSSPQSSPTSSALTAPSAAGSKVAGTRSAVPSTETEKPARAITPLRVGFGVTRATSTETSTT